MDFVEEINRTWRDVASKSSTPTKSAIDVLNIVEINQEIVKYLDMSMAAQLEAEVVTPDIVEESAPVIEEIKTVPVVHEVQEVIAVDKKVVVTNVQSETTPVTTVDSKIVFKVTNSAMRRIETSEYEVNDENATPNVVKKLNRPIQILRDTMKKLKGIKPSKINSSFDSNLVELVTKEISLNGKSAIQKQRVVYVKNSSYKVGWVLDSDVFNCMICLEAFGFMTRKHHCRACGLVLCAKCTSCKTVISTIETEEPSGSKVCTQCIGGAGKSADTVATSDISPASSAIITTKNTTEAEGVDPKYLESYRRMRSLIPLNIAKMTIVGLVDAQLPLHVAERILANKGLWLIVMHPDDIRKVHIADLRGKYAPVGLDLTEMRAIWHNLPAWKSEESEPKMEWRENFRVQLESLVAKEAQGKLVGNELRHEIYAAVDATKLQYYNPDLPIVSKYQRSASIFTAGIDSPKDVSHSKVISPLQKNILDDDTEGGELDREINEMINNIPIEINNNVAMFDVPNPAVSGTETPSQEQVIEKLAQENADIMLLLSTGRKRRINPHEKLEVKILTNSKPKSVGPEEGLEGRNLFAVTDDSSPVNEVWNWDTPTSPKWSEVKERTPLNLAVVVGNYVKSSGNERSSPSIQRDILEESCVPAATSCQSPSAAGIVDIDTSPIATTASTSATPITKLISTPLGMKALPFSGIGFKNYYCGISTSIAPLGWQLGGLQSSMTGIVTPRGVTEGNVDSAISLDLENKAKAVVVTSKISPPPAPLVTLTTEATTSAASPIKIRTYHPFSQVTNGAVSPNKRVFISPTIAVEPVKSQVNMISPVRKIAMIITLLSSGKATEARGMMADTSLPSPVLNSSESTMLLLKCSDDPDSLHEPLDTITLLVDDLHADVNSTDATGRSPILSLFTDPILGRFILSRGGDILLCDKTGSCALSLSMEYGIDWLLEAFESTGLESALLLSNNLIKIKVYTSCLIVGGYALKAAEIINDKGIMYTATEANDLKSICADNTDNMQDVNTTYELLTKLGADLD